MNKSDPYLYEDCGVLINRLNIKNREELDEAESDFLTLNFMFLKSYDMKIESVFDVQKIHYLLFSDLYDWAGNLRIITMYKREPILGGASVDYTPHEYIKKELTDLDKEFQSFDWSNLNRYELIKKIAYFTQQVWQIHPFREGNTRTTEMFLYFLLKRFNIHINTDFLGRNAKHFRNSLVLASLYSKSQPEYLEGIIEDIITFENEDGKYETIEGFEVEKYEYTDFTTEKIKCITKDDILK